MKYFALSALSGVCWWLISLAISGVMSSPTPKFFGSSSLVGAKPLQSFAGAVLIGILMGYVCRPLYRDQPIHILWLGPLSLYAAVALYAFFLPSPGPGPMVSLILAMWWGITVVPWFIVLVPASYVNHILLRRVEQSRLTTRFSGSASPAADREC